MIIGIALGILIGLVTGAVFIHLVKVLAGATSGELKVVAEVLAIPTFWFGGPWIAAQALQNINWEEQLPAYSLTLMIVFLALSGFPVIEYIKRIVSEIKDPR